MSLKRMDKSKRTRIRCSAATERRQAGQQKRKCVQEAAALVQSQRATPKCNAN
jgi:hypothetical protein